MFTSTLGCSVRFPIVGSLSEQNMDTPTPNKKRKLDKGKAEKGKVFQYSWLDLPQFKGWLEPVKDNLYKSYCRACNTTIVSGKSEIEKHSKCAKHLSNQKAIESSSTLPFKKIGDGHDQLVKKAEIKLACFFAEHNIALQVTDHLIPLIKSTFTDSKIASSITLGRTKCTQIIKNVIAKMENENLRNILEQNTYSVLIDESTDISNGKNMCCLVRYVEPNTFSVKTELLELINLNAVNCSSEHLFKYFKDCLARNNIPLENLIGMASDNASVMIGAHNSFYSRLKSEVPHLILFRCLCHTSALVASSACKQLPKDCETLLRDIGTYISESPKTSATLQEFQGYFNVQVRKIQNPAKTRWLTLQPCVVRLIENWQVLQHLFLLDSTETKRKKASDIYGKLVDPTIKAYFYFMKYVLIYFNQFNALFQSNKVLIHALYSESRKILLKIAQNFIKPNFLQSIEMINNISDIAGHHFLEVDEVYVGPECERYIENFNILEKKEFKAKCQKFYKTALQEIITRLPLKDKLIKELEFLSPDIALDASKRHNCKDFEILPQLVNCDKNSLVIEWRELPFSFSEKEKSRLLNLEIEEFWKEIANSKDFSNNIIFGNLGKLAKYALSFPHSKAEAERIFSMVTDIKTKNRNRLESSTLNALCVTRSAFLSRNVYD